MICRVFSMTTFLRLKNFQRQCILFFVRTEFFIKSFLPSANLLWIYILFSRSRLDVELNLIPFFNNSYFSPSGQILFFFVFCIYTYVLNHADFDRTNNVSLFCRLYIFSCLGIISLQSKNINCNR